MGLLGQRGQSERGERIPNGFEVVVFERDFAKLRVNLDGEREAHFCVFKLAKLRLVAGEVVEDESAVGVALTGVREDFLRSGEGISASSRVSPKGDPFRIGGGGSSKSACDGFHERPFFERGVNLDAQRKHFVEMPKLGADVFDFRIRFEKHPEGDVAFGSGEAGLVFGRKRHVSRGRLRF